MDTTQYKDVYVFCEQREGVVQSVACLSDGVGRMVFIAIETGLAND